MFGVFVVQIIKFASEWLTFEHNGKCYSISSKTEFNSKELSEVARMTFDEVKAKYELSIDSDEH